MTEPGGWTPDEDTVEHANLTRFMAWLAETGRGEFADYHRAVGEVGRATSPGSGTRSGTTSTSGDDARRPRCSPVGKCLAPNGFRVPR